ncbi:MAG: hypothetical protein IJD21_05515 [Oscillospiraceae bacterium]|nr:hypothetical protein [Oscillospiraceae bacterium]
MANQGLSTIGIEVEINSTAMNYVTEIGDIGGSPSTLDATCMKDTMKKNVPGVQETKAFEVTYLFDNSAEDSDYRRVKALQEAGKIVPLTVTFPDGTIFSTTGYVNTYIVGSKVDELISAKLVFSIQSEWVVNHPAA